MCACNFSFFLSCAYVYHLVSVRGTLLFGRGISVNADNLTTAKPLGSFAVPSLYTIRAFSSLPRLVVRRCDLFTFRAVLPK